MSRDDDPDSAAEWLASRRERPAAKRAIRQLGAPARGVARLAASTRLNMLLDPDDIEEYLRDAVDHGEVNLVELAAAELIEREGWDEAEDPFYLRAPR